MLTRILVCAAAVTLIAAVAAQSQPPAALAQTGTIKRTPLQKFDVPDTNYETVIGLAELAPNSSIGRHSHPGVESGYMLEGDAVVMIEEQPDKTVSAGDSYLIPAGVVHDVRSGPNGARAIATYVVEKGKPLATPAK